MSRNFYNSVGGHSNPCSSNSHKDRAFSHGRSDINEFAKTYESYMYKDKKTLNNATSHSTIIKLDIVEPTDNPDFTQLRNVNKNREIVKPDFYDQYQQYANYYFNAKKEIDELKHELNKCNRLKEESMKVAFENEQLKNELRYYYKMNSDIARLEKEKNNLFDAVKDIPVLETNIEELHNVMDESLEKNKNLTNENTNLKNQISELKDKFRNSQEVFDLECKQLKSEIDNLKRNLSKLSISNEDLNNTVAKLEKEKNDICKEARERISELETYIKDLKYAVTKLEKEKNDQFNEAKQIISKLETEIKTQKHHLKMLNEENRSLINENNKRSPINIDDSHLNDTIAKLEEEKNKIRNAARQKISELEKKIEGLELHVKKLDEEKTNLLKEENKSSRRIVTDSAKFASLPQFCVNSGVRNSEVVKSESKEENNDCGLRYNSEEMIKLIDDLNRSKYRCRDYRKKYNECKTLNEKLKTGNSNYEKEISQLKEKLDDLTISTREVSNWNTDLNNTVAKLKKEKNDICKEARKRISELETYIKDLKYAVTKLEKEKNDQFNEAKEIISKLETEIENITKENGKLKSMITSLEENFQNSLKEKKTYQINEIDLKITLQATQDENVDLKAKLDLSEKKCNDYSQSKNFLEICCSYLKAAQNDNIDLKAKLGLSENNHDPLKSDSSKNITGENSARKLPVSESIEENKLVQKSENIANPDDNEKVEESRMNQKKCPSCSKWIPQTELEIHFQDCIFEN